MVTVSYERSNTTVNDEMKRKVSSNLPVVRNVYTQPRVPKRDVELRKRPVVHHTTARTKVQDDVKHRPRDVQGVELPLQRVTSESVTYHATRSDVKKNETVDRFLRSGLGPGLV